MKNTCGNLIILISSNTVHCNWSCISLILIQSAKQLASFPDRPLPWLFIALCTVNWGNWGEGGGGAWFLSLHHPLSDKKTGQGLGMGVLQVTQSLVRVSE